MVKEMKKMLILNNSKTAQGHIELILSFIIFVGFVVALLLILRPTSQKSINYSSLEDLQIKVINNLSINYNYAGLILKNEISSEYGCFWVENKIGASSNSIVLGENGGITDSKVLPGKIYIQKNGRYYKIYFDDKFENPNPGWTPNSCFQIAGENYAFGALTTERAVFYENLDLFNKSYMEDYSNLKKNLKVDNDFDFIVFDLNRNQLFNESLYRNFDRSATVLSNEIALKAIDKTAQQKDIILRLRLWQ